MKTRQDICNIVNHLSYDYSMQCKEYNCTNLSFQLMVCYNLILNYCKVNKTAPKSNTYKQVNGLLYINDKPIERIALRYIAPRYDTLNNENKPDYEGMILARQEVV